MIRIKIFEAGFCKHPEYFVDTSQGFKPRHFSSTVVLIDHPQHGICLFDTGYSMAFHQATKYFPEKFYALLTPVQIEPEHTAASQWQKLGIRPQDVNYVILSHFHADHVSGVSDFPKARIVCIGDAFESLKTKGRLQRLHAGFLLSLFPSDFSQRCLSLDLKEFQQGLVPALSEFEAFDLFKDESLYLINLPGHSQGHMGLYVNDTSRPLFFVGDASWRTGALRQGILPSVATALIHQDWSEYRKTFHKVHGLVLRQPELDVVTCHCEESELTRLSGGWP